MQWLLPHSITLASLGSRSNVQSLLIPVSEINNALTKLDLFLVCKVQFAPSSCAFSSVSKPSQDLIEITLLRDLIQGSECLEMLK